jgi:hypothetical protein
MIALYNKIILYFRIKSNKRVRSYSFPCYDFDRFSKNLNCESLDVGMNKIITV